MNFLGHIIFFIFLIGINNEFWPLNMIFCPFNKNELYQPGLGTLVISVLKEYITYKHTINKDITMDSSPFSYIVSICIKDTKKTNLIYVF